MELLSPKDEFNEGELFLKWMIPETNILDMSCEQQQQCCTDEEKLHFKTEISSIDKLLTNLITQITPPSLCSHNYALCLTDLSPLLKTERVKLDDMNDITRMCSARVRGDSSVTLFTTNDENYNVCSTAKSVVIAMFTTNDENDVCSTAKSVVIAGRSSDAKTETNSSQTVLSANVRSKIQQCISSMFYQNEGIKQYKSKKLYVVIPMPDDVPEYHLNANTYVDKDYLQLEKEKYYNNGDDEDAETFNNILYPRNGCYLPTRQFLSTLLNLLHTKRTKVKTNIQTSNSMLDRITMCDGNSTYYRQTDVENSQDCQIKMHDDITSVENNQSPLVNTVKKMLAYTNIHSVEKHLEYAGVLNMTKEETMTDDFKMNCIFDYKSKHTETKPKDGIFKINQQWIPKQVYQVCPFWSLQSYFESVQTHTISVEEEMSYEARRLQSFLTFPSATSTIRLSQAGFYYSGHGDETICFSCGVRYNRWSRSDQPLVVHRGLNPCCPFLTGADVTNKPIHNDETERVHRRGSIDVVELDCELPTTDQIEESHIPTSTCLSVASVSNTLLPTCRTDTSELSNGLLSTDAVLPTQRTLSYHNSAYPQYCDIKIRLKSFEKWPSNLKQRPISLAQYGFYYAGYADCVRCFHCGIGLKTWEPDDDPLVEHIHWRPSCEFILFIKGSDFIEQTIRSLNLNDETVGDVSTKITSNTNEGLMQSDAVIKAKEMGYKEDLVAVAVIEVINRQGQNSLRLETLLEEIFAVEERQNQLATSENPVRNPSDDTTMPPRDEEKHGQSASSQHPLRNPSDDTTMPPRDEERHGQSASSQHPLRNPSDDTTMSPRDEDRHGQSASSQHPLRNPSDDTTMPPRDEERHGQSASSQHPLMNPSDDTTMPPRDEDRHGQSASSQHPLRNPSDDTAMPRRDDTSKSTSVTTDIAGKSEHSPKAPHFPSIICANVFSQHADELCCSEGNCKNSKEVNSTKEDLPVNNLVDNLIQESGVLRQPSELASSERHYRQRLDSGYNSIPVSPMQSDHNSSSTMSFKTDDRDKDENERDRLLEENRQLRDEMLCKICLEKPISIVFLPCGHYATCAECAPALSNCPICRTVIRGSVRVPPASSMLFHTSIGNDPWSWSEAAPSGSVLAQLSDGKKNERNKDSGQGHATFHAYLLS